MLGHVRRRRRPPRHEPAERARALVASDAVVAGAEERRSVTPGWSNAVEMVTWAASTSSLKGTASRRDQRCWGSSLMSPLRPAMGPPRRHFDHAVTPRSASFWNSTSQRAAYGASTTYSMSAYLHGMARRGGIVDSGGLWREGHGAPEGSEVLGLSSRVRRAAPRPSDAVCGARGGQPWPRQDGPFDHAARTRPRRRPAATRRRCRRAAACSRGTARSRRCRRPAPGTAARPA